MRKTNILGWLKFNESDFFNAPSEQDMNHGMDHDMETEMTPQLEDEFTISIGMFESLLRDDESIPEELISSILLLAQDSNIKYRDAEDPDISEKKANPFAKKNAKKDKKDGKKEDKKEDKGGKKGPTAAQKAKLPWLKNK